MGGVGITVFTDMNFRGKSATFRQDVSDLSRFDLNDKISSLKVAPGDDKAVLEREINLIQTLLDEQPDSKCEYY